MKSTPAALARYARYRKARRHKIGTQADRARARTATNKSAAKHRAEIRATKRNRAALNAATERRLRPTTPEFLNGFAVVTAHALTHDRTRWTGPGWLQEMRLEEAADRFILEAEKHQKSLNPKNTPKNQQTRPI